jgi:hypothetical protein
MSLCYELVSSAERNKQTARGRSTQCTNNRDPITSTSELLLRQSSVTAHAHQSQARRLACDHCATEINRPNSAARPIHSAAGGITSIEESSDFIGNGTRKLSDCSVAPRPSTLPGVVPSFTLAARLIGLFCDHPKSVRNKRNNVQTRSETNDQLALSSALLEDFSAD